jgi:hypothetical protein
VRAVRMVLARSVTHLDLTESPMPPVIMAGGLVSCMTVCKLGVNNRADGPAASVLG